jgi:hypothetical protein
VPAPTTATTRRPLEVSPVEVESSRWSVGTETARPHGRRGSMNEVEQICERVRELDSLERTLVLRALKVPPAEQPLTGGRVLGSRHRIAFFLVLCCLGLIPWTIGLAVTLPRSYLVGNWPLAWTGFDIVLLGCLGTTAWALWRQRQVAVAASMVTSVLLLCDAWFDIVTAHSGRCLVLSLITAVFAEIPIAVLLGVVSVRLLRANARAVVGIGAHAASLWRAPLGLPASNVAKPHHHHAATGTARIAAAAIDWKERKVQE